MRNTIIVDVDGTLSNTSKRVNFAQAGEWDMFHSLLHEDEPWEDVKIIINNLSSMDFLIIGLTGRNEKWRAMTGEWLFKHKIQMDDLIMRPDGDFTPDKIIKPKMLNEYCLINLGKPAIEEVLVILEDRDRVVEEWRNLGFNCWQVRAGGY